MTTRTPAAGQPRRSTGAGTALRRPEPTAPHEPAPAESGPFAPRLRGRHRRPRPRKALLAAGGLALVAGALSLLRLSSGPGTDGVGPVEARPRPGPVTTGTDEAADPAATTRAVPEASPSSLTALGGPTPSPVTKGARPALPATTGPHGVSALPGAPEAAAPAPTTTPDTPNTPAPTASDDTPPPARAAPAAPPSRTTPAPPPERDEPKKPDAPRLCVPVIGLCVDSPIDRR
ncbi:hypothetical protein [Streptomyces sp. NPDC002788]